MAIEGKRKVPVLRTPEIDEIIGSPPHWLVQWGITVFFAVLLLVLGLGFYIDYPENITVPYSIVTDSAPLALKAPGNGTLLKMLTREGAFVHKGDSLFYWRKDSNMGICIFTSPMDGTVEFISPLTEGKVLTGKASIFFIVPQNHIFYASIYVNDEDAKKIKTGQKVTLKPNPSTGRDDRLANGTVDYISKVRTEKGYYVKVLFSALLKPLPNTVYGSNAGTAEILISNTKLIYKLLRKLK